MGLSNTYNKAKKLFAKEVRVFNASDTPSSSDMPFLPSWFWTAKLGMPRKINVVEVRQYAKSCWVQMVTNAIIKQLRTTDWKIIPYSEEDETDYSVDIEKATTFLNYPNSNGDGFWDVWAPYIRDVLEIDAGVVWKGFKNGELVELRPYDGSKFLFDIDAHGVINGFYQYSYKYPTTLPKWYEKDDLIYGRINLSTEQYPYGFSPLQSIQQEVEVMIQSSRYNKELFKNNAIPDGIVSVPMERTQMERFKHMWKQETQGKPHKLVFHNVAGTSFTDLRKSNTDMQWLEGQHWYFHTVFGAYGLSPQEVGFYENSNRSTGESQERTTIKNAIKPYYAHLEQKINREVLPVLLGHDNLKFRFFPKDDVQEKLEHEQNMAKLVQNVITINELRKKEGLEPVEWGDEPFSMVMQDRFVSSNTGNPDKIDGSKENTGIPGKIDGSKEESNDNSDSEVSRDDLKDRDKKKSFFTKPQKVEDCVSALLADSSFQPKKGRTREESAWAVCNAKFGKKSLKPFSDYEAREYDDFLSKEFSVWENKILNFLDDTLKDDVVDKKFEKSFGEFLQRLGNVVNTQGWLDKLKRIISIKVNEGISEAENELNLDIGVTDDHKKIVSAMADRQLEGFYIDGKRWQGLKGVSNELQKKLSEVVRDGIAEHQSLKEIKDSVKKIMVTYKGGEGVSGEVTNGRAMRIARTESNRFHNAGKLEAYKKSGLKGVKKWVSFHDERSCEYCKALDGVTADLSKDFEVSIVGEDSKKVKSWNGQTPPLHPSCRCKIVFDLDD